MSIEVICATCKRNCCSSLKKPSLYKIGEECKHFSENKCLIYTSKQWKDRLNDGRTFLCELFPAIITSPRVENDRVIIEIHGNQNCPNVTEILNLESEKKKIKEIIIHVLDEIKQQKILEIPWFQYHVFKKTLSENEDKKVEIIFK